MTPTAALLAFAATALLLTLTPGLDTALVLRTSATEGLRRALMASLGICAGCLAWGIAAAIGLGALLAASPLAYDTLRVAGALYLFYLGARLLWRGLRAPAAAAPTGAGAPSTARAWLWRGCLSNLLNPKVGVFYLTLLPQFIPAGVPVLGFSLLLATLHAVISMAWLTVLALATRRLGHWLARPAVARSLDGITGALFVGVGLRLALVRP